ncbi:MAG: hypothetical protein IJ574_05065 [Bacilli bacterium]|nr:hypothetical protein [Bacilli bacterium]
MSKIIAITGPSMVGKTTLTNSLKKLNGFSVPKHITTREKRVDDENGFYRYVNVSDFNKLKNNNELLLYSGAGNRLYGILKEDLEACLNKYENAVINISYKDIFQYNLLEYQKILIALTFHDLQEGIKNRNSITNRKMVYKELLMRIEVAMFDHKSYFDMIKQYCDCLIYTDDLTEKEVYEKVMRKIK